MKIIISFFIYIFIRQPAEEHDNNPDYRILHQTCICYFQKTTYIALCKCGALIDSANQGI